VVVVGGCIRTVIGQAELLMAERFKQFAGLVDNCEFGTGQKEVTTDDLQGFWDMIYFQVLTTTCTWGMLPVIVFYKCDVINVRSNKCALL